MRRNLIPKTKWMGPARPSTAPDLDIRPRKLLVATSSLIRRPHLRGRFKPSFGREPSTQGLTMVSGVRRTGFMLTSGFPRLKAETS